MDSFADFSVGSWLENNGLGHLLPTDKLWGDAIKFVSEVIGLDKFFLKEQCDISKDPYKNATMSWNNGKISPTFVISYKCLFVATFSKQNIIIYIDYCVQLTYG